VFRDYDLIQGKPAKKAEAMLRDFIGGSGGKVDVEQARRRMRRRDVLASAGRHRHDQLDDGARGQGAARRQGHVEEISAPDAPLAHVSEGVRTIYPGATSGLYVPEEVRDFDSTARRATRRPRRSRSARAT
jgi:hypothetical protein